MRDEECLKPEGVGFWGLCLYLCLCSCSWLWCLGFWGCEMEMGQGEWGDTCHLPATLFIPKLRDFNAHFILSPIPSPHPQPPPFRIPPRQTSPPPPKTPNGNRKLLLHFFDFFELFHFVDLSHLFLESERKKRCDSIKKKSYNSRHVSKKGRDEGDVNSTKKRIQIRIRIR